MRFLFLAVGAVSLSAPIRASTLGELQPLSNFSPVLLQQASSPRENAKARQEAELAILLKLAKSENPQLRAGAARALRPYLKYPQVAGTLLALALNPDEIDEVKIAAIKSIAKRLTLQNSFILERIALDEKSDPSVRSAAIQALHASIWRPTSLRDRFLAIARNPSEPAEVRNAAAWALSSQTQYSGDVSFKLLHIVLDPLEPLSLRVQSTKSLFGALHSKPIQDVILSLAKGTNWLAPTEKIPATLRTTAILALQAANKENEVKKALKTITEKHGKNEWGKAAREALRPRLSEKRIRWFGLHLYQGRKFKPLENP